MSPLAGAVHRTLSGCEAQQQTPAGLPTSGLDEDRVAGNCAHVSVIGGRLVNDPREVGDAPVATGGVFVCAHFDAPPVARGRSMASISSRSTLSILGPNLYPVIRPSEIQRRTVVW